MILFHPSSLGTIMTDPKNKAEVIDETCKKHLIDVFIAEKYGRRKTLENKWLKKGIAVEDESIGIFNKLNDVKYVKNTETIKNDFIIGTPDIISDEIIGEAKSSYDIWTFLAAKYSKLDKDYYWQVQGYMWLTGLKSAKLFYALCNTPVEEINDNKKRLAWKMNSIDEETDEYIERCKEIERNAIYDIELFKYDNPYFDFHSDVNTWNFDIPMKDRFHCIDIPYDEKAIDKLKNRIEECRKWMDENMFNVPERIDIEGV
jgi:hypothetical protein